jgi:hypothetical protein
MNPVAAIELLKGRAQKTVKVIYPPIELTLSLPPQTKHELVEKGYRVKRVA